MLPSSRSPLRPVVVHAVVAVAALARSEPDVVRPGDAVEGVLADDARPVVTETLAARGGVPVVGRAFGIEVEQPGTYRVELRSWHFDAYLVLRDAGGRVIAEDDDGLVNRHARIVAALEPGRPVEVVACALHGGRGPFELVLRAGAPAPLDARARAAEALADERRRVEVLEEVLGPDDPELARALDGLGQRLFAAGDPRGALPLHERALAIRERTLAPDDPDLTSSLNNVAYVRQALGDLDGAQPLYERALAAREAALGPDHPDVATVLNNLGLLARDRGDPVTARSRLGRALAIRERALGPDDPAVATSLNNLALALEDLGEYAAARPLLERSLAIREAARGPDHPHVATALDNLAELLRHTGELERARALSEHALAIREAAHGPVHPDVAVSLGNLAVILEAMGDLHGARRLHEGALAIKERTFGPDHPQVALALNNLAGFLMAAGEPAQARRMLDRALAIWEDAVEPGHPRLALTRTNLAGALAALGDDEQALRLYERALATWEAALGPDHPDVARAMTALAGQLSRMGEVEGARAAFERALASWDAAAQAGHPALAHGIAKLSLPDLGDPDARAERLLERAQAIWESALGPEHRDVARVLTARGAIHWRAGEPDRARPLFERALAIWEEALGPEHPAVAAGLANVAAVRHAAGDPAGARPLLERAAGALQAALGPDHPDVVHVRGEQARAALDDGDPAAARTALERAAAGRSDHLVAQLARLPEADGRAFVRGLRAQLELMLSPAVQGDEAWVVPAYEALLAWKGQVLRAARLGRARLRADLSEETRAALDELQRIAAALSRATSSGRSDGEAPSPARVAALIRERARLERDRAARAVPALPDAPDWATLRDALPESAALVDVLIQRVYEPARREDDRLVAPGRWSAPRAIAWITRRGEERPRPVDLGPATRIAAAAESGLTATLGLRGGAVGGRRPAGDALREIVWDPLAPHLDGVERVLVSPDGVLAGVPFGALRERDGRYLVEERGFVSVSDPTSLVPTEERAARPRADSLLAVGGVDFDAVASLAGPVVAPGGARARATASDGTAIAARGAPWRPLGGTAREVERIAALHAAAAPRGSRTILTGARAHEEALKRSLPGARVVHLATHGFLDREGLAAIAAPGRGPDGTAASALASAGPASPVSAPQSAGSLAGVRPGLLSGIVCAGANAELPEDRDDGYLTAEEVGWLDLSGTDLVVLSACDTGLGRPESGEGLIGLRRAFLMAGARTVVSSLWALPDQATAAFMERFYRNLWARGLGAHEALRAAQLETLALEREQRGDADPRSWGAFVLDGDWR